MKKEIYKSQHESGGNTKTPDSTTRTYAGHQCYRWGFTLKATYGEPHEPKTIDPQTVYTNLTPFCKEFYYQLELSETGYLHYQGCLSLHTKHRMQEVKNILGWNDVHLFHPMNWFALKNYCTKGDTREAGPWSHTSNWIRTITNLYPWQSEVADMIKIECNDDRSVYWYWEATGKWGKSQFCKWAAVHLGATILRGGALRDIARSIPDQPKIIMFDFTRTVEDRVNYEAIEACKDGMIFSAKYESKMKIFNSPHVVIVANFHPDETCLSLDRWKIKRLGSI